MSESESYVTTDGQSASLSWNKAPIWGLRPDLYYYQTVAVFYVGRSLWQEDGSVVYNCCWPSPALSFSGSRPVGYLSFASRYIDWDRISRKTRITCQEYVLIGPLPSTGHDEDRIESTYFSSSFYCCVRVFRSLPRNGSTSHNTLK
jgi:hypothetical protein